MRILFTRFPLESAFGGAEKQTLSLMKGLRGRSHAVAFLGSCPVLLKECADADILNANLEIGPPPVTKFHAMSFFWHKQGMQRKLEAALNEFGRLDAILMLSMSEKLLLTEAAVKKGVRVFWVEHDRVGPWLTKNPWLPKLRKLSEKVTTVCVSELSRMIYIRLGWNARGVIAIPNGIDLAKFSNAFNPQPATRNPQLRIGCVARLSQEKGIDLLIQAAAKLPEVDLTVVGVGPEEGYLRKIAQQIHDREMQTAERIHIVPRVDDLAEFYRSIDALVLPSRDNDPFGLVAAEAMACGTPVIVTHQCGISGYLQDGHDAFVVAPTEEAIQEGLMKLMSSGTREMLGKHGKETAQKKFTIERMVNDYAAVLAGKKSL